MGSPIPYEKDFYIKIIIPVLDNLEEYIVSYIMRVLDLKQI
jgi:hypothetical protein